MALTVDTCRIGHGDECSHSGEYHAVVTLQQIFYMWSQLIHFRADVSVVFDCKIK